MNSARAKKILYPIIFLFLVFSDIAKSQSATSKDSLLHKASQLFGDSKEKEALNMYLKVLEIEEDNFSALWHCSLLYARIGYRMDTEEMMMKYYQTSLEYAKKSLAQESENGYAHFVNAVAHGRISDLSKSRIRIKKSHIVKKHVQKAIELIPEFAPAWHVYALWHSKVANVRSGQKLAARIFSNGIPDGASNQKAVEYMQKAIDMDPKNELRYKLDLARHYRRAGKTQQAVGTLQDVLEYEPKTDIDRWNLKRAQNLLQKLQ